MRSDGVNAYAVERLGSSDDCSVDADVIAVPLDGSPARTLAHGEPGTDAVALAHDPRALGPAAGDALVFTNLGRYCNLPRSPIGQVRAVSLATVAVTTLADPLYLGWPGVAVGGTSSAWFARTNAPDTDLAVVDAVALP